MFSRLFGKKPKKDEPPLGPPDLSLEGLSALFGEDGVRETTNVVLTRVPRLIDAETRLGGLPGYVEPTSWPVCPSCEDPMMFIGQLAMGPDLPLTYPRPAILYIFLCQSDPTAAPECETWSPVSGCSAVFAQEGRPANLVVPDERFADRSRVEALVADSCARPDEVHTWWNRLSQHGHKEYHPTLFGQYECAFRTELSVCDQPIEGIVRTPAHYAAMAELSKRRAVFIGGFPDWVQAPSSPTCTCGKAMEFALQLTAFDEALNLGDAGEAYVFACPDRCSPTSFALEWQCC